jgi:hypothetical protein
VLFRYASTQQSTPFRQLSRALDAMNIYPNTGVEKVEFGMLREEIKTFLGLPDEICNPDGQDEITSEKWIYKKIGLELSFDPDLEFRFDGCYITSSNACLDDICIIGLSLNELVNKFPYLIVNEGSERFREVTAPDNEMYLTIKDGIVKSIYISPNARDFIYEYSSKSYKRMIASKRLIKNSIRKSENIFVSDLLNVWSKLNENTTQTLQSDFEWFLSSRLQLDVFPEAMWCDGTIITSIVFHSDKLLYIEGTADILSSNDDDFYQVCNVSGHILLNNKLKSMKKYNLTLSYEGKSFVARKGV